MLGRLLLDPWSPEYEASSAFDANTSAASMFDGEVDVRSEGGTWTAVPASDSQPWNPARLCFVDGVRRIEASLLAIDDRTGAMVHGLLASFGVGAVVCRGEGTKAAYDSIGVSRLLVLGSGQSLSLTTGALTFDAHSVSGTTPEDLVNALQQSMRTREAEVASTLFAEDTGVFADGPLTYHTLSTHRVTGVVKRIFFTYLDPEHMSLVARLETAERTPIFAIRDGKNDRYSWFQRLAPRRATEHSLTGIVRLEVRASLGIETAVEIASFAANTLPLYASSTVRDPRAPQNLLPVGALESELRHRLGDAVLIRRAIERAIAEGVELRG